jgi:hypothetical protein
MCVVTLKWRASVVFKTILVLITLRREIAAVARVHNSPVIVVEKTNALGLFHCFNSK